LKEVRKKQIIILQIFKKKIKQPRKNESKEIEQLYQKWDQKFHNYIKKFRNHVKDFKNHIKKLSNQIIKLSYQIRIAIRDIT